MGVLKIYAVKHKDQKVIASSRSGGIFTALSDKILAQNGVVYGCILSNEFGAEHVRAEEYDTRNLMRGSKYIQSKMGNNFRNVKIDLDLGRSVLFTGTSCQIDGLIKFLGKKYDNLFCVDIVCHGVPSPKVWKAYLKWYEDKIKSKIVAVDFRNKTEYGWRDHIESIYFENGQIKNSKIFTTLFYRHNILRPCCYECPYKSLVHPGDITIADYWGIEKAAPEFDDNKGVSLVLLNNDSGEKLFEKVKNDLIWKETRIEDSMQAPLQAPFPKPNDREKFWTDFLTKDFNYVIKKYANISIVYRIMRKIKKCLKKFLRK